MSSDKEPLSFVTTPIVCIITHFQYKDKVIIADGIMSGTSSLKGHCMLVCMLGISLHSPRLLASYLLASKVLGWLTYNMVQWTEWQSCHLILH